MLYEANPAFCRFAGRTREELLGTQVNERKDWYEASSAEDFVAELRRDGVVRDLMSRMVRPDGSIRIGKSTCHMVSIGGETVILAADRGRHRALPERPETSRTRFRSSAEQQRLSRRGAAPTSRRRTRAGPR